MVYRFLSQYIDTNDFNSLVATAAVGLLILYLFYLVFLKNRKLPPGPRGWPIVGYMPYLSQDWHLDFKKIGKKYGSIFSLYIGRTLVIVLNDYFSINEAINKNPKAFAGRPFSYGFQQINCSPENLFKDTFTPTWKQRKKFAMAGLRGHGLLSQDAVHEKILEQAQVTVDAIKQNLGKAVKGKSVINFSTANVITNLFFHRTYGVGDEVLDNVLDWTNDWFTAMVIVCEADVVPFYRFIQKKSIVKKGRESAAKMRKYFLEIIKEHRKAYNVNNLQDFLDLCIKNKYDDEEILLQLFSLWGDATDTVGASIRWWMYFVARHPKIQEKLQKEVDEYVGTERLPRLTDKYNLCYLEATFMEAMRLATPVPVSLPLMTIEKSKVLGYTVPANTHFFVNWYNLHTDPKIWKDPERFRPERYFNDKGEFMDKHAALMPFAAGKRNCIGEPIARDIVFLYCVSLMQNFTFKVPNMYVSGRNALEERDHLAVTGVTNAPIDFAVIAEARSTTGW